MLLKKFLLVSVTIVSVHFLNAQEMINPKEDFLYDGKYFAAYPPYVTVGAGYGINTITSEGEQNISVDFHMTIKKTDFAMNIGYFASTPRFLEGNGGLNQYFSRQKLNDFHAGVGYRYERLKNNFGIYGGVSFVAGRTPSDTLVDADAYVLRRTPGLYMQANFSRKPHYDVGYGISLYAVYSRYYKIIGVQAHIFLSSAFRAYNR
jgi:hypothetical protein